MGLPRLALGASRMGRWGLAGLDGLPSVCTPIVSNENVYDLHFLVSHTAFPLATLTIFFLSVVHGCMCCVS